MSLSSLAILQYPSNFFHPDRASAQLPGPVLPRGPAGGGDQPGQRGGGVGGGAGGAPAHPPGPGGHQVRAPGRGPRHSHRLGQHRARGV